jgi:arylsulfatase
MDLRGIKMMPPGPYQLHFNLKTKATGTGDIFFTTDGETVLPKGENHKFAVSGTDSPQPIRIDLKTEERIYQLRIDVTDGEGAAEISNLRLLGPGGEVIKNWSD